MNADQDIYYGRPELSNSDLSYLAKYWMPFQISYDIDAAYRFGSLLDAMITEPFRVDYYRFTCAGVQYTPEEFALAEAMKQAFLRDEFCRMFMDNSEFQTVLINPAFQIEHLGFRFALPMRGKPDFDARKKMRMFGDLKSTNAKTQKEFEKMVAAFHYDRQAAVYLDLPLEDRPDMFMLLAVSKHKPHSIFKVAIKRGEPLYLSGRQKYEELGFKSYVLFDNLEIAA
jgi:hypothetical protein